MPTYKTACLKLWVELTGRCATVRERNAARGALMAEYGLLVILIGMAAFFVIALLGGEIWELFRDTGEATDARQVPPRAD